MQKNHSSHCEFNWRSQGREYYEEDSGIGSVGQIGSELTIELRKRYGRDNVIATDRRKPNKTIFHSGLFEYVDATHKADVENVVKEHNVDTIYHLAAILSAVGEADPQLAWHVNMESLYNVLEVAVENKTERVFWPSSIAVFSKPSRVNTPQDTLPSPRTIYCVTKACGELLCSYHFHKFGLDIRSIRYPGIISSETFPGGGTTDYAVEMFYEAIKKKQYTCFLREDTVLPVMYILDCINSAINLMEADSSMRQYVSYNVAAMTFSPKELADEIRKYIPEFECDFKPDYRQGIADTWPTMIDDSLARREWGWKPACDLTFTAKDMISKLRKRFV